MVRNADTELMNHEYVISGDSIVINECISWYNLYAQLIADLQDPWVFSI